MTIECTHTTTTYPFQYPKARSTFASELPSLRFPRKIGSADFLCLREESFKGHYTPFQPSGSLLSSYSTPQLSHQKVIGDTPDNFSEKQKVYILYDKRDSSYIVLAGRGLFPSKFGLTMFFFFFGDQGFHNLGRGGGGLSRDFF